MTKLIAILPGDGIGPEIIKQAVKIIDVLKNKINIKYEYGFLGGNAYDKYQDPYPKITKNLCKKADAILLGAVGSPKYDNLPRNLRPERGLLAIRKDLNLFANLRPSILYQELIDSAPLKKELIENLDLLIVRELTGDIYFGEPRGIIYNDKNEKEGFNTMRYNENEIVRIAHVAFKIARNRNKKLCSVDKANVLETTELWREVLNNVHKEYEDVELTHMYVDNAAMQLVKNPKQFDVIVTGNIFGDILSDLASILTGSIGMLASASLNESNQGLYEPAHGSAPDIANQNKANPIATILSLAMLFKYSLKEDRIAKNITDAVKIVLSKGYRTEDIYVNGTKLTTCEEMGDLIVKNLKF